MELRPATREEFGEFSRAALSAFHRELSDEDRERYERIDEPERSLAWFYDGRIVATTGAFTRELTVPGGAAVPCAAVTAVAVVPTHRRRGLLTALPHGWRRRRRRASRCAPVPPASTSRRRAPSTSACGRSGRGCSTAPGRGG